ncbi:hypothetical protein ABEDC_2787 [Acinetobacter lwoffii]|nr:hypothetical protein HMPREF0017_00129 [Acinetobacter lwoffii SH145]QZM12597.1 hypothetical protein ABVS_1941 [Acinetobacter lwoffii]UHT65951.1 hypothetical protein ABEDC_2787 [Acinetobacter lwoffii]
MCEAVFLWTDKFTLKYMDQNLQVILLMNLFIELYLETIFAFSGAKLKTNLF